MIYHLVVLECYFIMHVEFMNLKTNNKGYEVFRLLINLLPNLHIITENFLSILGNIIMTSILTNKIYYERCFELKVSISENLL